MLITRPVFLHNNCNSPETTFLRFSNIVEDNKNASVVISNYNTPELLESLIKQYTSLNIEREVIIDCSTELINSQTVDVLVNLSKKYRITLYYNNCHRTIDVDKLKSSNITLINKPFFLEYCYYYIPVFVANQSQKSNYPSPSYLLLTGKPKFERALFVYKLYQNKLESNGIISYFGVEEKNKFTVITYQESSENYLFKKYHKEIESFNKSLSKDLTVDELEFTYDISHSRFYNGDLYKLADFVIVLESDLYSDSLFITEKPMKAIMLNKKFIYLAKKGQLFELKRLMLEIHNRDISELTDWIDTKYDDIEDIDEKFDYVIGIMRAYIERYKKETI